VLVVLDQGIGRALLAIHPSIRSGQLVGRANATIASQADVLLLGASTLLHNYDDRQLSDLLGVRVFNSGIDGRGLLFSRGLLALAAEKHRPRLVVFDVSYREGERGAAELLAPFYGRNRVVDGILGTTWRERVKLSSLSFRFNGLVLAMLTNRGKPAPEYGFEPLDGSLSPATQPFGSARPARDFGPWFADQLGQLVADSRAMGARIVFVESPTWGGPVAPQVLAACDSVARGMDVPFLRIVPEHYPELARAELYKDRVHLNRAGAEKFTALLAPMLAEELRRR
jgi:hypothetical protein